MYPLRGSEMSQSKVNRQIITLTNPKSPISEAFRTLRTNINFSAVDTDLKVLMVTSALPSEGKSTTLVNLATTYAQAEKSVVVLELDLRKPTVHKTLNISNRHGITNVLTRSVELEDVIQSTLVPNLYAIPSGIIPPNPSELLGSNALVQVIQQLKQNFDVVLIDTPPVLAVTDAQLISVNCDGVILVADSGKVKRNELLTAKERLVLVNAKILGVVLNNVKRNAKDKSYYYYYGEH